MEDCCGCPYNLVEEDDVFLKIMNEKRDPSTPACTEDQFEEVMHFFEETAQLKQPYAAVDNPPVLSYAEIEESFDAAVDEHIKRFAKDIYDHWKSRRISVGNRPLQIALKVRLLFASFLNSSLTLYSLKRVKKPTMAIRTCVFVGEKCDRFAKLVVEMPRVPRSCVDFAKNWKMRVSWSHSCDSGNLLERRCLLSKNKSSNNVRKSRI